MQDSGAVKNEEENKPSLEKKRELTQSDSAKQVLTHTDSTLALVESGNCCGEVRTADTQEVNCLG